MDKEVCEYFCEECGDPIGHRVPTYLGEGRFMHYECYLKFEAEEEEKIRESILRRQRRKNKPRG